LVEHVLGKNEVSGSIPDNGSSEARTWTGLNAKGVGETAVSPRRKDWENPAYRQAGVGFPGVLSRTTAQAFVVPVGHDTFSPEQLGALEMFSWKSAYPQTADDEYRGHVYELGKPVMGLLHYAELGYRLFWMHLDPKKVTAKCFIELINQFVSSADIPELPKDRAMIVSMDPNSGQRRGVAVAFPLSIADGNFNDVPVEKITSMRIDVPEPMSSSPTTVSLRPGQSVTIPVIGPLGILGLGFEYYTHKPLLQGRVGIADPWLPTEQLIDFWTGVLSRELSAAERDSLREIIEKHCGSSQV
jgi:hypothetical protein